MVQVGDEKKKKYGELGGGNGRPFPSFSWGRRHATG